MEMRRHVHLITVPKDAPYAVLPSLKRRTDNLLKQLTGSWIPNRSRCCGIMTLSLSARKHTLSRCDTLILHGSFRPANSRGQHRTGTSNNGKRGVKGETIGWCRQFARFLLSIKLNFPLARSFIILYNETAAVGALWIICAFRDKAVSQGFLGCWLQSPTVEN